MSTAAATEDQLAIMAKLAVRIRRVDMFGKLNGNGKAINAEIKAAARAADGTNNLTGEQVCAFIDRIAEIEDEARREHGDERVDSWFRNEGCEPRRSHVR